VKKKKIVHSIFPVLGTKLILGCVVVVEWLILLLLIRGFPSSNLGAETGCSD
jgi:hypothetical protein